MKKYKRVRIHNHPLFSDKTRVYEHRLVMAESLGRPLLRSELVHHKNENTLDNQIDNLEIMMCGEHTAYHRLGKHASIKSKRNMSIAQKGRHHTIETRQKMSLNHKGFNGKHHTMEAKRKISLNHKGKHPTVETRKKLSVAKKDYYLRQRFPGV